jgi:hypothetical protein
MLRTLLVLVFYFIVIQNICHSMDSSKLRDPKFLNASSSSLSCPLTEPKIPATPSPEIQQKTPLPPALSENEMKFKACYPWVNPYWYKQTHKKTDLPMIDVINGFIVSLCRKPAAERELPFSEPLFSVGRYAPYDHSTEHILNTLAVMYKLADPIEGLKIADLGCGPGVLAILINFISDGEKPLTIYCVDGVQANIDTLIKTQADCATKFDFRNIFYKQWLNFYRTCLKRILLVGQHGKLSMCLFPQMFYI